MKKRIIIVCLLITATALPSYVKLAASKLDMLPVIGINGEAIALIKQFQSQITKLLKGELTPYEFEKKKHTIAELRQRENQQQNDWRFPILLQKIRADFEKISEPFHDVIQGAGVKAAMGFLIKESCSKRNRLDSLLYIWVTTDEKNEYELFDFHIKSITDVEIFLIDLHNFLGDLVFSCPRAHAQFKDQIAKFKMAKSYIPTLNIPKNEHPRFLKHIHAALPKLSKHEINQEKIKILYTNFKAAM